MKRLLFIFIITICSRSYAQNVAINNSGSAANTSAILDISSASKGLLIPRVNLTSLTDETTIVSPAPALLVYNTNAALGTGFYYNSNTAASPSWTKLITNASASGWGLAGNDASIADFIGTTNARLLKFKVNNQRAGFIDLNLENTSYGFMALADTIVGNHNTAFGARAMSSNKWGNSNTAVGYKALYFNTSGGGNIAIGENSLYSNTTGNNNFAVGSNTMFNNIDGKENIALGEGALLENSSGSYNIGLGYLSMYGNKTGGSNIAMGYNSLYSHKTGDYNIATGAYALRNDSSGANNIATGYNTLYNNYSGADNIGMGRNALYNNTIGSDNIAIGREALYGNTNLSENIAIGYKALTSSLLTGDKNTAIGVKSLSINGTGYQNTAVGYNALGQTTSGFQNTAIGYSAFVTGTNSNSTVIGSNAYANCSNCMVLGGVTPAVNIKVGIGISDPQTNMHINPNGAGSILIGKNKNSGGYTNLEMGISQEIGGSAYIQSIGASGANPGSLSLNPNGGNVAVRIPFASADMHIKQSNESYPLSGGGLRLERQINSNHWDIGTDNFDDLDFIFNGVAKGYINDATGAYVAVSDLRMKKDIQLIGSVLPALMQLQPKTYHYIDNKNNSPLSYGFIAQEVEKLFPDFVFTKGADEMKAISYQNFTIVAIKAIQEQQKEIESLKEQNKSMIEEQQKAIQKLEERMKLLESK